MKEYLDVVTRCLSTMPCKLISADNRSYYDFTFHNKVLCLGVVSAHSSLLFMFVLYFGVYMHASQNSLTLELSRLLIVVYIESNREVLFFLYELSTLHVIVESRQLTGHVFVHVVLLTWC